MPAALRLRTHYPARQFAGINLPGSRRRRRDVRRNVTSYELTAITASAIVIGSWFLTLASAAPAAVAGNPQAVAWSGFAENAQHTSLAQVRPQPLRPIRRRATGAPPPPGFL